MSVLRMDLLCRVILCLYHMMLQGGLAACLQDQLLRWGYSLYIQNMAYCPVLGVHSIWQSNLELCKVLQQAVATV